jgi:hypothetical protein
MIEASNYSSNLRQVIIYLDKGIEDKLKKAAKPSICEQAGC